LKDNYISYVLLLNDAIEEGNYRKVFHLRSQNPLPDYFGPFLDRILETVRTEIAKSAEKAYTEISLKEALSIFQFQSVEELRAFVNTYHENLEEISVNWIIEDRRVVFERDANKKLSFNSEEMIQRMLEYSVELEKIA
jgi:26S proteasome regulatory subunit N12